jgi:hypothetical protein
MSETMAVCEQGHDRLPKANENAARPRARPPIQAAGWILLQLPKEFNSSHEQALGLSSADLLHS